MTDHSSPEKSPWGWKALIIFCVLGALFLGFFYLAVTNDADYMPSQQNKENMQHETTHSNNTAEDHNMTQMEHSQMTHDDASTAQHGH